MGEPVFNVRKIKSIRTVKASSKGLNIKPQQSSDRVKALGADLIDENDENNWMRERYFEYHSKVWDFLKTCALTSYSLI